MSDPRRPMGSAETELRRSILADATDIPVISVTGLRPDADKQVGDEFVRCTGFGVDQFGWPVMTGCQRGVAREDGGSEPRGWPAGTPVFEVGWTAVDILTEIPEPTLDMAGRQFQYRDATGDYYTFNVIVSKDGVPIIDWLNEPPGEDGGITLILDNAITGLTGVQGVAVDGSNNLYAVHGAKFSKWSASLVLQWSTADVGAALAHVATDGVSVFAADAANNVVYKRLASTGAAASPASFGTSGSGDGQLLVPISVCTDGTHVWVTDRNNDRVQKFTVNGVYVSQFGAFGTADGQFDAPEGIALRLGKLYVLDAGNNRVQRFDAATHAHELTIGLGEGNADGQLFHAAGIGIDSAGNIWIADAGNHRIQLFDSAGAFLAKVGSFGGGTGQLKNPTHIALNAADLGYVADRDNGRIQTVHIAPGPFEPNIAAPAAGDLLIYDGAEWVNQPSSITPVITRRSNSVSVGNTSTGTVTSTCNADEVCISCGVEFTAGPARWVGDAYVTTANGCYVSGRNNSTSGALTLWAHAMCMQVPLTED